MKFLIVLFMMFVLFYDNCDSQRRGISNAIMQLKKSIDAKLCSDTDYADDIIARIEGCNQFDPHYKLDRMYKECHDMVPSGSLNWNQKRKLNCKIRDCYDSKYQTNDYNSSWEEIRKLSDYEMEKRQTKKFECLEKVMSMK